MIWILVVLEQEAALYEMKAFSSPLRTLGKIKPRFVTSLMPSEKAGLKKQLAAGLSKKDKRFLIQVSNTLESARERRVFESLIVASTRSRLEFIKNTLSPLVKSSLLGTLNCAEREIDIKRLQDDCLRLIDHSCLSLRLQAYDAAA